VVGSLAGRKPGSKYAVAGHLSVPGVVPGEEVTEMPRGRDIRFPIEACAGVDLLMNGHIHRRQVSPDGVVIPGSLAKLTFSEEENTPGFLIIDV
jgi:DNA repair exonuclease SbcCD nuclease subunit